MVFSFPGGKRVDASFKSYNILTDQSKDSGGQGAAPEPFDYFLASIGACAGIYVLNFCQFRKIPTDGMKLVQKMEHHPETKELVGIKIEIELPEQFPAKYEKAVIRAVDQCAVKKKILDPPRFEISLRS
jgi:ribosomal protein S12 methylthiotransferase accessory factor